MAKDHQPPSSATTATLIERSPRRRTALQLLPARHRPAENNARIGSAKRTSPGSTPRLPGPGRSRPPRPGREERPGWLKTPTTAPSAQRPKRSVRASSRPTRWTRPPSSRRRDQRVRTPVQQDHAAGPEAARPRRGERPQRGRPSGVHGDPAAVQVGSAGGSSRCGACPMIQQESRPGCGRQPGAKESSSSRCSVARRRYASIGDIFIATVKGRHPRAPASRRATSSSASSSGPRRTAPSRRVLHPLRRERRRDHQRPAAARGTRIFGPVGRAARQEVHAHRVARPGGDLTHGEPEDQEG